ncbi:ALP1-like protein isoform X1 [Tanacetum coccineum]
MTILSIFNIDRYAQYYQCFRIPRANNGLNILYGSSLFYHLLADKAPEALFVVNEKTYEKGYYLADEIYPQWSTFVKAFNMAMDQKTMKFKRVQESSRKDIERAFGVLQGRWGIIQQPTRAYQMNTIKRTMYCRIILHNMILQDQKFDISEYADMYALQRAVKSITFTGNLITRYEFMIQECAVSSKAILQHVMVLLTTEAEYMTLTVELKDDTFLKGLSRESGFELGLVAG